uniref:NEDD8 ultimate buster 1 n=1 Tax=Kalanchoe fedtschenkoi TaxID=63787 RepID=A0A7N0UID3_KALFE
MAKLRIAGTFSGAVEVDLDEWTVERLREEVARRSNMAPEAIKLICSGKVLKDDDRGRKLAELGVKDNAKVLASRNAVEEGNSLRHELMAEDERNTRLARVRAAATALSKRHTEGSLPIEDFNLELEDQSGKKVNLGSETDQQAVMMGLMLHTNGKHLIKMQNYKDALEVLAMGEEAFSLCNPKVIEMIDNVPILQIDMVWCYFMLRDISWLSDAGKRLVRARQGIERAHGKDSFRVRLLQGGRYPELALHLRLELLEGVVAYHSGEFEKSKNLLTSAQAKYSQLQVSDEALSVLLSMGYKERQSKRALRMTNQNIEMAIDFLVEERSKREQKRMDDLERQREILEQKQYGVTANRKAVDLEKLKELVSIGFEKALAAEALRRNENNSHMALDDLTNPEMNATIQHDIETKKRKKRRQELDAAVEELVSMGFERSRVVAAVEACGTTEQALTHLLTQAGMEPPPAPPAAITSAEPPAPLHNNGSSVATSNNEEAAESSSQANGGGEERDEEMEDLLARELQTTDALSDYDIEVTQEGEAINEYLALLSAV